MEMIGLAKVRKLPPRLTLGQVKPVADVKTLEPSRLTATS
jgi:hypothetical protein